ncbi:MAG: leucine-rich repeat protein [Lachnospiraceae bacterium]|nr:leucine-rich repeat protein [Lachnospiraceae bacterium]
MITHKRLSIALILSLMLSGAITLLFAKPERIRAAESAKFNFIIDTCEFEELGDGEYRIFPGYDDNSVMYRIGSGKWQEVSKNLKETAAGCYGLTLAEGETVSIKAKQSPDTLFINASFGMENSGSQGFGPVSAPKDFDQSGFFAALTSEGGYSFTYEGTDTYRLAVNFGISGSAPDGAEPQYKYFLDFSKFAAVASDGSHAVFDVGGTKVKVTIKNGKFTDGGAYIPEDLSNVVFVLDSAFDANSMSVYIRETARESNPFVVDLWATKGTNEVSLDKSDIGSGHWPDKMSFVIAKGKTKTYTPDPDAKKDADSPSSGTKAGDDRLSFMIRTAADGTAALAECKNIGKSLIIPNIVSAGGRCYLLTAVSKNALSGEKALKKLTIPSSIKKVGKNAFKGCSSLKTIQIKATKKTYKKIASKIKASGISEDVTLKRIKN